MYSVYALLDKETRRIYIGRTNNLKRRINQHKSGKVWTTRRMESLQLVFCEIFLAKADAIRRERYLKTSKGKSTLKLMLRESLKMP